MPYLNFYSTKPLVKFFIAGLAIVTIGIIISFSGLLLSQLIFWLHLDQVNDLLYGRFELMSNAQLRFYQAVQTIGYFIIPGFFLYWIFSDETNKYFSFKEKPEKLNGIIILLILVVAIPFINWLFQVNHRITLPGSFSGTEETLQKLDQKYSMLTERLIAGSSFGQYCISLFIIAVLPAIGEEIIFRGVIQKIFLEGFKNIHFAVILSALIFSGIHVQFYGFIPRFFLGLFFGYLMIRGKSIWYPILAHFFLNAISLSITYSGKQDSITQYLKDGTGHLSTIYVISSVVLTITLVFILMKRFGLAKIKK